MISDPPSFTALIPYEPAAPSPFIKTQAATRDALKPSTHVLARMILERQCLDTYQALHLGGASTLESRLIQSARALGSTHSAQAMAPRLAHYEQIVPYLQGLTNQQLDTLLQTAKTLNRGIGGEVLALEVHGVPLIIKKIRLTDIEKAHPRSTSNLFELPPYYQYGVGSMGFGVWRELAAHEITSKWVLKGACQNFPLLYHARVLARTPKQIPPVTGEMREARQRYVEYWDGSLAVGRRMEAAETASADVVLFMERFSQTLHKWLKTAEGSAHLPRIEHELKVVAAFMRSRGFVHFDAHFHNILADNHHVYLADFGLALSRQFDLAPPEQAFLEQHIDYDGYYLVSALAERALTAMVKTEERERALEAYFSDGRLIPAWPTDIAAIAQRYRPIALLMDNFLRDLRERSKRTPYPEAALRRAWGHEAAPSQTKD